MGAGCEAYDEILRNNERVTAKINRKVLPVPELKRVNEYVAPEGEKETLFARIFSEVLDIEQVGATDNFFEIGGTSINAIKVIVEASKHGVQIVFNDLFTQKTPRALAEFVDSQSEKPENLKKSENAEKIVDNTPEAQHYAPLNALLATNTIEAFRKGERQTIGDVLHNRKVGILCFMTSSNGYAVNVELRPVGWH